jgi:hypothetical protein
MDWTHQFGLIVFDIWPEFVDGIKFFQTLRRFRPTSVRLSLRMKVATLRMSSSENTTTEKSL